MADDTTTGTESEDTGKPDVTETEGATETEDASIGDSGKKAIDAMKRERNAARKQLSDMQKQNAEISKQLKEFTDKDKTESERLQEASEEHKTRAATAEASLRKLQTALERAPEHATIAHIQAVAKRVAGESDEDIANDADELFQLFAPAPAEEDKEDKPKLPGKPKETLSGGGAPQDEPEERDPRKLADLIGRH